MDTKVLIAGDDPLVGRVLQQALQKAGCRVDAVTDGIAARERLATNAYEALVTDWMMRGLDGIELVRLMRKSGNTGYVALVTELNIPAARSHAIREGANEFFAKPVAAAQIVRSLTQWLERRSDGPKSTRVCAPAPDANAALGLLEPISTTSAWRGLAAAIHGVLSDTVQLPLAIGAAPRPPKAENLSSVLVLVDAEHLLELHVTVETSLASAVEVARAMLGEANPEDLLTLRDLVSELAHMVAGALKVSFSREGFGFTLGLAKRVAGAVAEDGLISAQTFTAEGLEVIVRCVARVRNALVVQPGALREGMVLAESLFSSSGGLLLPLGTRLTATAAERLRGTLKGRVIKVCFPEANIA